MANPQKENGYTAIANEIMDALCRMRINGEARQVLDFIIRKTYGYNKKQDKIALSQFVLGTGLRKSNVCRSIKTLVDMKIIIKIDNGDITIYQFNKDFEQWKALSKLITLSKPITTVIKTDNESLSISRHTKVNSTKDNITKVDKGIATYVADSKEIAEVFNIFTEINPTLNYGNKTHRKAASDLIRQFGLEKTLQYARAAIAVHGRPYSPTITNPYHLKIKLADLEAFYKKEQRSRTVVV